ncbi:putative wd40 protein [Trichoderma sp. SZMC 28015]
MDRSKYTVGWICALTEEFVAARAFLDEKHERLKDHDPKDSNSYALGKMSNHNIVIACLPLGGYGTVSAAGVAINMVRSFPNIRIGLMVGIGGGAPSEKHDIRLGDVVVSTPGNSHGGVFQYDFGKSIQAKEFVETGFLDQPPEMLRTALQDLKSDYELEGHTLVNDVEKVLQDKPSLKKTYGHPNVDDHLYESFFVHSNPSEDCQSCGNAYYNIKQRDPRDEGGPVIHYGLIASGNQVMKDARIRDKLARERGVLCFEMEAAGLMNRFPCLVIRGICDYSDSHKNDKWHGYAAMIAAAYTKDLLRHLIPEQVVVGKSAVDLLEGMHGQLENLVQKTDNFNNQLDLAKLPTAHGAEFDSFATQHDDECLTGTRTEILHLVGEWAASPQGKCIFWLNGMAGTGKSTICRTLAKHFQEKRGLGATFFFKRGEADRGNASKFFPTIAKQIYQKIPGINLRKIIDEQPDIANKALSMQFEKLILQPLSSLHSTSSELPLMTIVIDALDECEDDKDIRAIIQLLPQVQATKCVQLKVFITSRPELPIRLGFKDVKEDYQDLALHHVPRADIEHDISLFINHKLNSIRKYRSLPHDWPGGIKIQTLVAMSVPLFIFAATVCRMLQDHDLVPEEALEDVFKYKAEESKLDAVYLPILNRLHLKYDEHRRQKQFKQVQELVNTIILLENPLSIVSLSDLVGIPTATIKIRLGSLHSVLHIPVDENVPVRLFHLSFRDFLLDRETREKTALWIDEEETHRRLTTQCLHRMSNSLKKNICNLSDSELGPREIDADIIDQHIPPDLQYSCRYWVYHLIKSQNSATLVEDAFIFLKSHLLHWIEAMGILGLVSDVIHAIKNLQSIAQDGHHSDMLELLYDARRFILRFRYVAGAAPLQLYISGLTFAPTRSTVSQCFIKERPDWIFIPRNIEDNWDTQLQTLRGHTASLQCITFSPNGLLLASCAYDKTVRIWEIATGTLRQTFTGYEDSVACVAFSLDSRTLASISKDGISKFWDVDTGVLQRTIQHDDSIDDAAFSLDISLLATRRSRKIIIWDLKLGGTRQYELDKTSGACPSLAFSADRLLLAGVSDSEIIVWDIATGAVRQTIKGQSGKVESLAFSPNSLLLASGHEDSIVKLWDIIAGTQKYCFKASGSVNRLAFSPDNQFLAIGHHGGTTLWDLATYRVYKEHPNQVDIIAYSPDGRTLASTYRNNTIELWDLDAEFLNQRRHSESIEEIEFSSDGKLAISYPSSSMGVWSSSHVQFSSDGKMVISHPGASVSVWDSSQEALQQVLKHTERNPYGRYLTALSVDGRLLACSSRLSWDEPRDFNDAYRQIATSIDIWDIKMGTHWSILMDGGCHSMAFSPNNQQLATFSWEGISSWVYSGDSTQCPSPTKSNDNATKVSQQSVENDGCWVLQQTLESKNRIGRWTKASSLSFSPDGRQLALCFTYELKDFYCFVEIWDWTTGSLVQTLQQGPGRLQSVAFSTNGQLLAREQRYDEDERPKMCAIIEPWDMDTGKLHKDLVRKSRYSFPTTGPPPVEGLEFLRIQNRYVKCKDITVFEKEWVCFQGRKILWLPPKYRATCSAANDTNTLAIGHEWGEVTFIKFSTGTELKI